MDDFTTVDVQTSQATIFVRSSGSGPPVLLLQSSARAGAGVMSIEVDTTHQILANSAKRLFAVPDVIPDWGVTPDGARFLFAVPVAPQPPFNIVQAWRSNVRW